MKIAVAVCNVPVPFHIAMLLLDDLAGADLEIEPCGVEFCVRLAILLASAMVWHAKPGCAAHHKDAVERMVNLFPLSFLLSSEVFHSLEDCNRWLRRWVCSRGF